MNINKCSVHQNLIYESTRAAAISNTVNAAGRQFGESLAALLDKVDSDLHRVSCERRRREEQHEQLERQQLVHHSLIHQMSDELDRCDASRLHIALVRATKAHY